MFSLVYLSRARERFDENSLLELLRISRQNNAKLGVTGLLLYKDGNFLQLLEGEEAAVQKLYAKIENDPRHFNVTTLMEGPLEQRQFPAWSMGFQDLRSTIPADVPGFSQFLEVDLTPESFADHPTQFQQILLLFRKMGEKQP
jgi:hypothetical protein